MFREEVDPELARVGDGARLLVVGRWVSGCCRRLLSGHRGSEWKGHRQGKYEEVRQWKTGFTALLPLARHGQKPVFKLLADQLRQLFIFHPTGLLKSS